MPTDFLNAMGHNQYGVMSDTEKASFGSAQQAQDFILRKRLQDEALAHEDAIRNQGLTAQERMQQQSIAAQKEIGGTFADRSALEDKRLDRQLSPQMEALRQAGQHYTDERSDTQGTRDFNNEILKLRSGLLSGQGGVQFSDPKIAERARYATLTGQALPESPEDKLIQQVIASLAGQAAGGGDMDALKGLFGAAKSGDITKIPTNIGPAPQALDTDQIQASTLGRAKSFAERDAATIGFDPTMDDVKSLVKQRDDLANSLKAKQPRISQQQAIDAANRLIDDELEKQAGHMGTGWIRTARQALGLLPGD